MKARYSKHYEISEEALLRLIERTDELIALVETVCKDRLEALAQAAKDHAQAWGRSDVSLDGKPSARWMGIGFEGCGMGTGRQNCFA